MAVQTFRAVEYGRNASGQPEAFLDVSYDDRRFRTTQLRLVNTLAVPLTATVTETATGAVQRFAVPPASEQTFAVAVPLEHDETGAVWCDRYAIGLTG